MILRALTLIFLTAAATHGAPWTRHTIDDSSRGADGVRLAHADGDGLLDIVTGWEEGGVVRIYKNPGPRDAKQKWPAMTAGAAANVEDAVLVDLDGDGFTDVVSSSEGKTKSIYVHWAPKDRAKYWTPTEWKTEALPKSVDSMMWMFALPRQSHGGRGINFFAGGKGPAAKIGWWQSAPDPRKLADWRWHPLRDVGWLMSMVASDMDGDGDLDLLFSDRKGPRSGCYWLENSRANGPWIEHPIGAQGREAMFMAVGDLDLDGLEDVVVAVKPKDLVFLRRKSRDGTQWDSRTISLPENSGNAKAVSIGDIDLDGRPDLAFTCEGADNGKSGVMWLFWDRSADKWNAHDISGPDGIKYDLAPFLDVDGDGDLDVLTCEETKNLGVVWYENPLRK